MLRYEGEGAKPAADAERVRQLPGMILLGESPRMMLVEYEERRLLELVKSLPGWMVAPETTFSLPDCRKKPQHPPA